MHMAYSTQFFSRENEHTATVFYETTQMKWEIAVMRKAVADIPGPYICQQPTGGRGFTNVSRTGSEHKQNWFDILNTVPSFGC
jgi:hypothetical protein